MRLMVNGATRDVFRLHPIYPDRIGCLLSPMAQNRVAPIVQRGIPWVADNSAFSGFDRRKYAWMLWNLRDVPGCLWVAAPDVVCNAKATLELFHAWRDRLNKYKMPIAFVGQDGAKIESVPWSDMRCLFLGGSTAWKLGKDAATLALAAKQAGKLVHMGRVNSLKRIRYAMSIGCDSVDGGSMSRFGRTYIERFIAEITAQSPAPSRIPLPIVESHMGKPAPDTTAPTGQVNP